MSDLSLFDIEEPIYRPPWGTTTCHTCGQPLRRYRTQNPNTSWYRWELDHTAWDHLRNHEHGRLLLRVMPWAVGSFNATHIERATA